MLKRSTLTSLAAGAFLVWLTVVQLTSDGQAQERTPAVVVTQETYCRAETDRTFNNTIKLTGEVNRFYHFRKVTPLDNQTVVRMNRDTLYSPAVVDTSKGATITVPKMPDGRYCSVLLIDNDHYCPGVIYEAGTHQLPQDTKYLGVLVRIQLLKPTDPEDVALVNRLQDHLVIKAGSADPFPEFKWDANSLEKLTAAYKAEFAKYDKYPDGFMGARGVADEKIRHIACAGAWGLFPNEHAVYINYNAGLPAKGHHTATYKVPENNAFWSITVYGADGYMKSDHALLNGSNTKMNPDGTFTVHFGSKEDCGDVPNRLDVSEGWNFLMRVYRPGKSVLDGSYKLPDVILAKTGQDNAPGGKPKYSADVPPSILTPDVVKTTSLGDLDFFDGLPSEETAEKVYDYLDTARGVDAFLNGMPAASLYSFLECLKEAGMKPYSMGIVEGLIDAKALLLTPNTTTVYGTAEINVKDGPVWLRSPQGFSAWSMMPISAG